LLLSPIYGNSISKTYKKV